MSNDIKKYEPFFGEWKLGKELGSGKFGTTYEIYKELGNGKVEISCLKYVNLPFEKELEKRLAESNNDYEAVRRYYRGEAEKRIYSEVDKLRDLRGTRNVIRYEEHRIIDNVGKYNIGWEMLLRTERLYKIDNRFSNKNATQYDVVEMGLQLLSALNTCEQRRIVHGDIKPDNIMIDRYGYYKLVDFGVSTYMRDRAMRSAIPFGTPAYMSPEIKRTENYDYRIDQYSLGLVLYFFLNGQRRWFCKDIFKGNTKETERSTMRRFNGEKLPDIEGVSIELNEVIQRMVAFDKSNRYRSARDAYEALREVVQMQGEKLKREYLLKTTSVSPKLPVKEIAIGIAGALLILGILFVVADAKDEIFPLVKTGYITEEVSGADTESVIEALELERE